VVFERPPHKIPLLLVGEQVWEIDKARMGFERVCRLGKAVVKPDVDALVGESGWAALPAPIRDLV